MKNIIITGSEGQIGRKFVEYLKKKDFHIIGIDIGKQCNKYIEYYNADITKINQIKPIIENLNKPIDALVNNAGVAVFTPFEDRTVDEIESVIDVNLKGNILMTKLVYETYFKPNSKGNIINIGSIYGSVSSNMDLYGDGDRRSSEIYGATKAAIIQLTKYFSAYMSKDNIRVNCISPGGVFNDQSEFFINNYNQRVPLGRMCMDNELTGILEFLLSNKSSYITGQNIIVDGGYTAW
ncbi:MAG: short-chain dehydrogenase [Candidatus Marinimicrobia bacterium]|nr:short-chain dehydrogenase [Candidatus Neomarinimicrobiota bacterium]|tara:strand:+ start:1848 stop:2558 length:711 start_codon:yes stop_codon:yes gene_type:complete